MASQMRPAAFLNPPAPGVFSSVRSISSGSQSLRFPLLRYPQFTPSTAWTIRMGGGPRTYPGGVSKWQWKRMQQKKAKQLLKARLCRERQIYEMRKRAELKAAIGQLEMPWEDAGHRKRAPVLFSLTADDQVKNLADRFQKPGGYDLWCPKDGPQVFQTPDGLPSARFFPKGVVHTMKPHTRVTTSTTELVTRMGSLTTSDQAGQGVHFGSNSSRRAKTKSSVGRMLPHGKTSGSSTIVSSRPKYNLEGDGGESGDKRVDEDESRIVRFSKNTGMLRNNYVNSSISDFFANDDSDFNVQAEWVGPEMQNDDTKATKFDSWLCPEFDSDTDVRGEFDDGNTDEEDKQPPGFLVNTTPEVNRRKGPIRQNKAGINRRTGSSLRFTRRSKVEREYEEVFGDQGRGQVNKPTKFQSRNRSYRQR